MNEAKKLIEANDFEKLEDKTESFKIFKITYPLHISFESLDKEDRRINALKMKFEKLIKKGYGY